MNRISYTVLQCKTILLAFILGLVASPESFGNTTTELDRTIENRLLSLGSPVDVQYSPEVKKRIRQYIVKQRKTSEALIGRSSIYFTNFENILREKGLPQDLKYLSVIESGLRPAATSGSGAAGLWQFMKPTGRMMGLKITRNIDERRDIDKSTAAAADYLLHLYERFDDWTLAIAAYNCGPGNMRKAIRKAGGSKDFWVLKKYLPRETREYVPKFIAMTYVMNYYYAHDLVPTIPNELLTNTSSAQVFESLNLKKLSTELDMDLKIIRTLNPSFIRNYIPKSEEGIYQLVLPTPEMRIVAQKYHVLASLPKLKKREEVVIEEERPIVEVSKMPSAVKITTDFGLGNNRIKSMFVHPVSLNNNNEREFEFKPEAYKINDRRRTISSLKYLIKLATTTT